MAEQIAQDPSFAQMAQAMQANMGAMMGGAAPPEAPTPTRSAAAEEPAMPGGMPGMPGMPGMDPSAYANMMSGVLQNPQFVEMAEKLGQQIMQVPLPHGLTGSMIVYLTPSLIGSLIAFTTSAIDHSYYTAQLSPDHQHCGFHMLENQTRASVYYLP